MNIVHVQSTPIDNTMVKSYRIKLIPTEEQEKMLWAHVDAMRSVWNWGLSVNMERFRNGEKHLTKMSLGKILTELKQNDEGFKWLNEVSVQTLAMALLDLDNAYAAFFGIQKKGPKYTENKIKKFKIRNKKLTPYEMNGHPKYKSKHEAESKFYTRNDGVYLLKGSVVLEKIGRVKYQTNYAELPIVGKRSENTTKYINPRVRYESGKWILSFGIERESAKRELNDYSVGIDLGVSDLAVYSYDHGTQSGRAKNVNKKKHVRRLKKRMKRRQRSVSRKYRANGNHEKTARIVKEEAKIKKLYRKLANIRHNHAHHATSEIIKLSPGRIVIEDLNISGMMKNKHLSEAIAEQCLHEFRRQIEYKAKWAGIEVVLADRFYPSSKKCSSCDAIKRDLKLKDRVYKCDECGLAIDRDLNAAKNLEMYAV
ncbi:MAG: transposase [Oscillospiraceae bacterium]|nr:transposase [Oscillospiraceae bacterium]